MEIQVGQLNDKVIMRNLINELISACNGGPEDWSDIHAIYDEIKATGNTDLIKKADYVMTHV